MSRIAHREVQVLGKAVRFKKTFLEAGAAFEYPGIAKNRMISDACQQPAQRVVLLDHIGFKLKLASELQHLFAVNHCRAPASTLWVPIGAMR